MPESLSLDQLQARLIAACDLVIAKQDELTKADQAIGDGDHGVTMTRGCKAARDKLGAAGHATAGDLLKVTGTTLMSTCGGASGAVFGTLFRGAAKGLTTAELDGASLARALADGLAAVEARGGAKPGDKTMIDALAPAAAAALDAADQGVERALAAAAEAASAGVEATKGMVARTGKAKTLGERALGHPDPGALSFAFIMAALSGRTEP